MNKFIKYSLLTFAVVIFSFAFFAEKADAATFYVNNSLGTDDAGHGGAIDAGAWRTLKYALTGSRVAKGDTVYVQAGTWSEDQINVAVGAGDGNPVVIDNYNDDAVTIQTGTVTNGLFFINSIDMTFNGINFDNNGVSMSAKYIFGLYSTTTTVDLIVNNATIDGDNPSGYIRIFKLYGTQPHNLTVNKVDITNGGMVVETAGTGGTNNNVTFFSSIVRNGYVVFFPSAVGATTLTLKNSLFTRQTGYGFLLNSASSTVDAKNNIFIGGGAYIGNIWNIGTSFGLAAIANNALFDVAYNYYYTEDSPFDINTFGDIITSTQVVPYISKQNWFVDPNFTSLGTDYTLASGSLVAQRGTNDHPTDGTDINGVAYGTNDVGPYVNPTLTALPSLDTDEIAWHGDSIMGGTGATGVSDRCYSVFDGYTPDDTVANYAIAGQFSRGLFWAVDQSIWTGRESTAIVSIGINDLSSPKGSQTNAQVSSMVVQAMDKLDDAGITPIYMGVSSIAGNPPDNTNVDAVYDTVAVSCTSEGWACNSIQTQMENNASWKTDYFADLTTNVHPNDNGHLVFARLAEYLFYTKYTMGTDEVDIGAGARLYADGKFRNVSATTGVTADFTVTPVGGVGAFDSDDRSAYMDITISNWSTTGDKDKTWTASSSTGAGLSQAGSTVYTIGDLLPSAYYQFKLDGALSTAITGSTCNGSLCQADSSGSLTFTYTGGYSSHTFNLDRLNVSATIPSAPAPSISSADDASSIVESSTATGTCSTGLNPGDSVNIYWSTSSSVNLVNLHYSTDSGLNYSKIAGPIANTESYSWTIPTSITGSTLQFKIEGTDLATITATFETETCALNGAEVSETDNSDTDTDSGPTEAPLTDQQGYSPVTGELEYISAVSAGDFIKSPYFSTVYYIELSSTTGSLIRRPFMDAQTFFTYADTFLEVKTVTDATLATMVLGSPMLPNPGIVLVKIQSDPRTYAVDENNNLRWITSEEVATDLYETNWADYIIDIQPTFFTKFGTGDSITDQSDITVSTNMKTRAQLGM